MPDIPIEFRDAINEILQWTVAVEKRQRALERTVKQRFGITEGEWKTILAEEQGPYPNPSRAAATTWDLESFAAALRARS